MHIAITPCLFGQPDEQCVKAQSEVTQAKVANNQLNGSYGLGILGAVIGGIIGAIPNILTIVIANYILTLVCALIPLGAYFGYKLFRGKMNNMAIVAVVLVSIVMIPLSHFALFIILSNNMLNIAFASRIYMEFLANYEGIKLLGQIAMSVAIGLFFCLAHCWAHGQACYCRQRKHNGKHCSCFAKYVEPHRHKHSANCANAKQQ